MSLFVDIILSYKGRGVSEMEDKKRSNEEAMSWLG